MDIRPGLLGTPLQYATVLARRTVDQVARRLPVAERTVDVGMNDALTGLRRVFRHPGPPPGEAIVARELDILHQLAAGRTPEPNRTVLYYMDFGGERGGQQNMWTSFARRLLGEPTKDNVQATRGVQLIQTLTDTADRAAWTVKRQYSSMRPPMVDPTLEPVGHYYPGLSYVSGHSAAAYAGYVGMAHLDPARSAMYRAFADDAAFSRGLAGVHMLSDIQAGRDVGLSVAGGLLRRFSVDDVLAGRTSLLMSANG